jgi:hypothetical protein
VHKEEGKGEEGEAGPGKLVKVLFVSRGVLGVRCGARPGSICPACHYCRHSLPATRRASAAPRLCADAGAPAQVSGPGNYFSDDEEEYPYREDSGSECGDEDGEGAAEEGAAEEDDDFAQEDVPDVNPGIWRHKFSKGF